MDLSKFKKQLDFILEIDKEKEEPEKEIEFLDIYNTIGINKNNYTMYLYDGTHANAEGNKLIVKCWLDHLLRKE